MRRQVGFLVEKRDGRREWLRATKLARSIRLALIATETSDDWIATELAAAVIAGLHARSDVAAVRTDVIADAVGRVLTAAGCSHAAATYAAVRCERARRRAAIGEAGLDRAAHLHAGAGATGAGVTGAGATGAGALGPQADHAVTSGARRRSAADHDRIP